MSSATSRTTASQSSLGAAYYEQAKDCLVKLVTALLRDKPRDPVPYIYSFLSDMSKGAKDPRPLTDNEVNEMRNIRKKVDHLKDQLDHGGVGTLGSLTDENTESDEDADDYIDDDKDGSMLKAVHAQKKKGQRAGVSAEAYGEWNKKGQFVPKIVPKTSETKEKLKKRLVQAFMFNALDEREFEIVVDSIEEVKVASGEVLIMEGDKGDCMYVVESGALTCTKQFKGSDHPTHLKDYIPGDGFGELALLYNAPRAATITAKTDSVVWRVDRDTFNHIVKESAARKREKYEKFLAGVKILQAMDPYERSQIADALQAEHYHKGDVIINEGDMGDRFYLIMEGEAMATKSIGPTQSQVFEYGPGDYFGERALLTNEARAASITVTVRRAIITFLDVQSAKLLAISLNRETFKRLLGPLENILRRNMDIYNEYAGKKLNVGLLSIR